MKIHRLLLAALGLTAGHAVMAAEVAKPVANVEVLFSKPAAEYTDVRDSAMPSDKGAAANLDELKRYLEMRAPGLLPAGQKLSVTLTDVDMAGEYEPWQQPGVNDVRIVKDLYPPRIDLEFKVTDAAGAVVKEGKRQLRDLSFMMKLSLRRDDPHRYEKALLDDWLRKDLPPAK